MFAAVTLVVIVAFLAFSIDFGYIVVTEVELQNAADGAAMSAARVLPEGRAATVATAQTWAAKNAAGGEVVVLVPSEDVEIGVWDKTTVTFRAIPPDSDETPNAVRVTCRRAASRNNPLKLFFAPLIGTEAADLAATAIAYRGGSCGGIMALNRVYLRENSYTDSYNSLLGPYGSGPIGADGDVCTNGHVRLIGYSGVNGDAHPGPEEDGVEMGSTNYVTGDTDILDDFIDFPPVEVGDARTSNDNDLVPFTASGDDPFDKNGEIKFKDDSLDLPPGTYYFDGITLEEGAIINISGPTTIYIDGDVELGEGGIVNQTGIPMNLQIYPLGTRMYLPEEVDLHAVIYSTTSAIEKNGGSAGFFGKMVGQKIKINGTGGLHVDTSIAFGDMKSGSEQYGGGRHVRLVY